MPSQVELWPYDSEKEDRYFVNIFSLLSPLGKGRDCHVVNLEFTGWV